MVAQHYAKLGFEPVAAPPGAADGETYWRLELDRYAPREHFITIPEPAP